MISKEDQNLIEIWNDTNMYYENNICIHHKLEKTSEEFPENTALSFNNSILNYSELNKTANRLANYLIINNIVKGDIIGVYMNRSIELIVSIYAILKTGGVYLPISTNFPKGRTSDIIDDAKPKFILTTSNFIDKFNTNAENIYVDTILLDNDSLSCVNPKIDINASDLAYIIYTSGTSGKPKGVLIEHHSVINRIEWMQKQYPISEKDVLIQKTPITFDVSIWELFWWSFVGAKLVLLPHDHEKDPGLLIKKIDKEKISTIHFVPSMFTAFVNYLKSSLPDNKITSLKQIFCSGEVLHRNIVNEYYSIMNSLNNSSAVINLYGPTEATVDVSHYLCLEKQKNEIPIGKPINNIQLYVIDQNNDLLPPESIGELVICGVGLSRGYLNKEDLSKEKFITLNVFGTKKRAYKTGDLAYYNHNGNLIYKGRNDNQVKIRGMRIELEEIENKLLEHVSVSECSCLVKDIGTDRAKILAMIVPAKYIVPQEQVIKQFLNNHLPDYMIPTSYIFMDKLILSESGKANKKAMLESIQEKQSIEIKHDCDTELSTILNNIWTRILGNNSFSTSGNFFDLGGNSLLIIQLSILIKQKLELDIDAITLMQYPTFDLQLKFIESLTTE